MEDEGRLLIGETNILVFGMQRLLGLHEYVL